MLHPTRPCTSMVNPADQHHRHSHEGQEQAADGREGARRLGKAVKQPDVMAWLPPLLPIEPGDQHPATGTKLLSGDNRSRRPDVEVSCLPNPTVHPDMRLGLTEIRRFCTGGEELDAVIPDIDWNSITLISLF